VLVLCLICFRCSSYSGSLGTERPWQFTTSASDTCSGRGWRRELETWTSAQCTDHTAAQLWDGNIEGFQIDNLAGVFRHGSSCCMLVMISQLVTYKIQHWIYYNIKKDTIFVCVHVRMCVIQKAFQDASIILYKTVLEYW
jgi:hypothetical protein